MVEEDYDDRGISIGEEALYNVLDIFDKDRRLGIISKSDFNFIKKRINEIIDNIEPTVDSPYYQFFK